MELQQKKIGYQLFFAVNIFVIDFFLASNQTFIDMDKKFFTWRVFFGIFFLRVRSNFLRFFL